jgi:hypothetical protein
VGSKYMDPEQACHLDMELFQSSMSAEIFGKPLKKTGSFVEVVDEVLADAGLQDDLEIYKALRPSTVMMDATDVIYREHCYEIVSRYLEGKDLGQITDMEIVLYLLDVYNKIPNNNWSIDAIRELCRGTDLEVFWCREEMAQHTPFYVQYQLSNARKKCSVKFRKAINKKEKS